MERGHEGEGEQERKRERERGREEERVFTVWANIAGPPFGAGLLG
jgi:hypothetical protein